MTQHDGFDRTLFDWLDERAGRGTPTYLDEVLARTTRTRQRPAWSSLERWLPVETTLRFSAVPRLAWLVALIALLAAVALAAVIGSTPRHLPAPFGPARNGTVVYGGSDGDIHSLNAATGATSVLVAGNSSDSAPLLSPDGTRFLFLRDAVVDPATDGKAGTIMVANVDGTNARALTGRLANIQGTAWSHDGSRVVVSSDQSGTAALTVFAVVGSLGPIVLDIHGMGAAYLAFRPGDHEVTFRGTLGATDGLFAVGADGQGLRTIVASGVSDFGILSPDGSKLAYQVWDGTNGSVHVVDVVTGRDITPVIDPPTGGGIIDDSPTWSPDGTKLLFFRYHGSPAYHLAVVPVGGGQVVELGPAMTVTTQDFAQFSPDGTSILAYYATDGSTWIIDPSGSTSDRQLPSTIAERSSWQRLAP